MCKHKFIPDFAALIPGSIHYCTRSYLGEKKKSMEDADKSEKEVKLHCGEIKVIFQAPTHACALIKNKKITIDVLMMCKGQGVCVGGDISAFLHFGMRSSFLSTSPVPCLCLAPPHLQDLL